ncbi:hypothetical protein AVEN_231368-1 [Araneus ventricosus]|uniref:Uncharacterized protein n=1 Tax=Araneus ventricosus TaxID=182803 RepID=A0A4Y2LRZ9_ARAVE|nr:hypothetical protein AVEN_231368-1 [Araneus ventricosus]
MYVGLLHAKSYVWCSAKFGEGLPARASASSSDSSSKLRGLSQSNPRVASKRDVNITKLPRGHSGEPRSYFCTPGRKKVKPPVGQSDCSKQFGIKEHISVLILI